MGEEVRITDYDAVTVNAEDDDRVSEWEDGLPNGDDLTPLSQLLISSELLSAFNITPEPYRSMIDVNQASKNTFANLRGESESGQTSLTRFDSSKTVAIDVEDERNADLTSGGSGCRKLQRIGSSGDGGGAVEEMVTETETETENDDPSVRVSKRQRLVWTPQLHKRFVEVVAHLGVKNAVPKTIMQLMNVEGLSRENVASHLQKYRLYLKRMQGGSGSGWGSDHGGNGNGYHPVAYGAQMANSMRYPYNVQAQQGNWNGNGNGNGFDSGYQHGMTPNKN